MSEQWKEIAGFPGYLVSTLGAVRGPKSDRLRGDNVRGYARVWLCAVGRRVRRQVSHLVLEAFVGPCPEGMQARHLNDNDRSCNRLDNLAWGTPRENAADRDRHGTTARGEVNGWASLPDSVIELVHYASERGVSARGIARSVGASHTHVGRILRGESRAHKQAKP